ncbi:MAG TPA: tRNA (adenosine(37)-N6)-threonylcarbamoyltransferase complex dimerization subunit type 1 TsaB [Solirubrobacteraceae bacterium]|jgi:tRNA threonylcarbamoyladenosine biosynthesis protein TsaB|nr:tRNA (adenosine(37)-N6)-threonylcarbamoyltransferase complex dimerization subunit type 1 TsaB [Solirubrobacteraceae bacterium]
MIVLGFDTATQASVVGLCLADGSTLQARDDPQPSAHPGHATRLLSMAAELLRDAGLGWSELERIAVGVGPGRFTGLRVGIATARGLAQSAGAELVGVSSLHALALGAAAHAHEHDRGPSAPQASPAGGTIAVIDARRGEAFAAAYPTPDREIAFAQPLDADELEGIVAAIERRGVPATAGAGWLGVGDGAVRFAAALREAGVTVPEADSPLHRLDAAALCELGARAVARDPLDAVLPDYRREPDAALARAQPLALGSTGS